MVTFFSSGICCVHFYNGVVDLFLHEKMACGCKDKTLSGPAIIAHAPFCLRFLSLTGSGTRNLAGRTILE